MKIVNVTELYSTEPVYDIEVNTIDHTFFIDKTRVENCRLLSDTNKLDAFKHDAVNKKDIEIVNSEIEKMYEEYIKQEEHNV